MGCRLYNGVGESSLMPLSIRVEIAISIVIAMFKLSNKLCVKY